MNNSEKDLVEEDQTCPVVGYQSATVCVPVTITPFAKAGITVTKCCGNAVVTAGKSTCGGVKNGVCAFTISQDICVAVPVAFGAVATEGDTFVNCNGVSAEDICSDCTKPDTPDVPVPPITPDVPVPPITPDVPVPPITPDVPVLPITPDVPVLPITPDIPAPPMPTDAPDLPKVDSKQ